MDEQESILQAISRMITTEIERPHVLICADQATGTTSYLGPFPDGLSALVAADEQERQDQLHAPGDAFVYTVAPLYRP
ncbi:MAG: hypothetical protein J7518_11110 [Nocardioidaceae bacterium]|nr:hypothetical protein [Nocardioidaceae bacterium]